MIICAVNCDFRQQRIYRRSLEPYIGQFVTIIRPWCLGVHSRRKYSHTQKWPSLLRKRFEYNNTHTMINCLLLNIISLLLIWIEEMEADKLTNFIISLSDFILLSWKHKKKRCVLWIFIFFQSNFTMFYTNTSLMTCIKYTSDGELKTIKMVAIVMETTSKFTFHVRLKGLI